MLKETVQAFRQHTHSQVHKYTPTLTKIKLGLLVQESGLVIHLMLQAFKSLTKMAVP